MNRLQLAFFKYEIKFWKKCNERTAESERATCSHHLGELRKFNASKLCNGQYTIVKMKMHYLIGELYNGDRYGAVDVYERSFAYSCDFNELIKRTNF